MCVSKRNRKENKRKKSVEIATRSKIVAQRQCICVEKKRIARQTEETRIEKQKGRKVDQGWFSTSPATFVAYARGHVQFTSNLAWCASITKRPEANLRSRVISVVGDGKNGWKSPDAGYTGLKGRTTARKLSTFSNFPSTKETIDFASPISSKFAGCLVTVLFWQRLSFKADVSIFLKWTMYYFHLLCNMLTGYVIFYENTQQLLGCLKSFFRFIRK